MKKFLLILLIISIGISFYFYQQNHKLRLMLIEKGEKISGNDKYVEMLTKKIELLRNATSKSSKEENLEDLLEKISFKEKAEKKSYANPNTPDLIPINGKYKISQKFSSKHPAVDFATQTGTKIISAADGEVLSVYEDKHYGNVVIIDHFNDYATLYAHLQKTFVEMGETLKKGQTIALSGNTGNSTAPHLHFEIMINGENVDPLNILKINAHEGI